MKSNIHYKLGIRETIGAASAVLMLPVMAIENPVAEELPNKKAPQLLKDNPREKIKGKKVAVLGVGGSPVSETLANQLGLEKGHGLTLFHIVPESAAEKAGLKVHDIITEFDGKTIGCQNTLKAAVLDRNPGDEITVSFIHHAQKKEAKAKLGGRVVIFENGMDQIQDPQPFHGGLGHFPQGDRQLIEQQMQKHMENMRQQLRGKAGMELDLHGILQGLGNLDAGGPQGIHDMMLGMGGIDQLIDPAQGGNIRFNSTSTVTQRDDQGSVTIKTKNGLKEILVRDVQGAVIYEGAYQTPQDKASVPDDIKQRLSNMNLGEESDPCFRLHMQGNELKLAPEQAANE